MIKKLFSLFAMSMSLLGTAHAQYTIHGVNMNCSDGTKIYLKRAGVAVDSAIVKDGTLDMSHSQKVYPDYVFLESDTHRWQLAFWLSNDQVTIDGTTGKVTGAPEEDLYQEYRRYMQPAWEAESKVMHEQQEDLQKTGGKSYQAYKKLLDGLYNDREDSLFLTFADRHPRAAICLNHIYNRRVLKKYSFERYSKMLAHLDTTAFGSRQWKVMKMIYKKDASLQPGKMFPVDITGKDVYGDSYSLSQYKGKYITLVFGTPLLGDYTKGVAALSELYNRYKNKNYAELDFVFAEKQKDIIKDCVAAPRPWTVISDYHGWFSPYNEQLEIDHVCQYFLIDPQGKILVRTDSLDQYLKDVKNILQ